MLVGPVDPQLASLQRLMGTLTPPKPLAESTAFAEAANALPAQSHSAITSPAMSVQMLVAIEATTSKDDLRRVAVEAERGRGPLDRARRLQKLGRPGVEQIDAVASSTSEADHAGATRILREGEFRMLAEFARPGAEPDA